MMKKIRCAYTLPFLLLEKERERDHAEMQKNAVVWECCDAADVELAIAKHRTVSRYSFNAYASARICPTFLSPYAYLFSVHSFL